MKKIQWQDNLSVGIELIDNQHKQWIEYYNKTVEAIASGQSHSQITKTLGFLIDYTEVHFSSEEKYMSERNYAGLGAHRAKHAELRTTLADLVKDFEEEGITHNLGDALETFLGNWLIKHIREFDLSFGAFVKKGKAEKAQ